MRCDLWFKCMQMMNDLYNFTGTPLTTCKACSLDVLSHAWTQDGKKLPSSTDGLNNNHQLLRPKSNYEDLKKVVARPAVYYSEGEEALSSTDFEEDFFSFDESRFFMGGVLVTQLLHTVQ